MERELYSFVDTYKSCKHASMSETKPVIILYTFNENLRDDENEP